MQVTPSLRVSERKRERERERERDRERKREREREREREFRERSFIDQGRVFIDKQRMNVVWPQVPPLKARNDAQTKE